MQVKFRDLRPFRLIGISVVILLAVSCSETGGSAKVMRFGRWAGIEEARQYQKIIDAFQADNPDIRVISEFLTRRSYLEKLDLALQTGDAPDVFMVSSDDRGPVRDRKGLPRVDGLLARMGEQAFPNAFLAPFSDGEGIHGVPVGIAMPVLFYNKSFFAQENIPFPSTSDPLEWDAFLQLMDRLKKVDDQGEIIRYPLRMKLDDLAHLVFDLHDVPTDEALIFGGLDIADAVSALEDLRMVYDRGYQPPAEWGEEARGFGTPDSALVTRQVAMAYTGMENLAVLREGGIQYGTMPLPVGKIRTYRASIHSLWISPETRHPDEVQRFMYWFATKGQKYLVEAGEFPANMTEGGAVEGAGEDETAMLATMASARTWVRPVTDTGYGVHDKEWTRMITRVAEGSASPENALEDFLEETGITGRSR